MRFTLAQLAKWNFIVFVFKTYAFSATDPEEPLLALPAFPEVLELPEPPVPTDEAWLSPVL